ncbi:P-loop containing nucleoside triphosphate hydrolase [Phytophthora cactorum]|nr:P-loop containing nucleoside triphosphate hydrolase [Phytophthora cactorum]
MVASAATSAVGVSRTIELLAPLYAEVCQHLSGRATSVPVTLQRTADDWLQLVFPGPNVRKDVACVNGASGCRCDFVRFLRALLVLTERQIVTMSATYAVTPRSIDQNRVATLQLRLRVHEDAQRGTSLKDFDFVLCHLQATVLTIVARNEQARKEALNAALEEARNSSCHVVGCRLHPWDKTVQPKQKLYLPDVFHSLTSQMEVDQMEIRDDATYVARMTRPNKKIVMTDLPTNVLQNIVCLMNARDLASLSGVCSLFQHMAYEVVPGLNLVLYEHQRRGLKWMLRRETPSLTCIPQPHPFILSSESNSESATAIDLIEDRVISHPHETARDACGGMFCDEPGLGKTITMLALILRTKGQTTDNTPVEPGGGYTARPGLRSSSSRGRSVNAEDLVSSGASLIVAPDPLVEHWKYQVEAHVAPGALRVFVDPGVEHKLPFNIDLAEYDVVITSFSRLAREWRLHRPTSALEARMPDRYGFEGPQRYADGTLRGNVSSLLTVHWVRVIVDEGHKLGGQTPSDLMQLARLICAERRWILPEPIRRTVFIDPTLTEYSQYNGIAAAVRANLVITNMDPKTPGYQHPDSLLNPVNRKEALRVVSNLRSACCGGSAVKVSLAESSRLDTINMLNALNVDGENMGIVIDYLRKVQLQGMVTQCGCCKRKLQLLMIIPCGHLCCADCVEDRMKRVGPICFRCNAVFDREAFQRLQPGFEFEMVEAVALEANNPGLNQEANGQNGRNAPRQPRRAMDLTRDIHFIDASKAFYAATRIKELKEEFLLRSMNPSGRSSRCQARYLKAIIFSQFKDHIWHTKVAFAQQGVPTADFIAGLSPEVRMKQLARFRKDPNVNVLLLTEVGSHGLDLSFVTHIFLMDEIWDKALEQQVISRAHRMGANQVVVVEQLWMRGSVESQMLKPHETDENQIELDDKPEVLASPTRAKAQQGGSPGRSPKKTNTGGGTMFNAPSKKRKRHRTEGDARTAAKSNKNTILQRKLNYVLHKLRLLEEDIVGEPGQVRFFVEDDHKNVIRQATHVIPNRGSTVSTANTQLPTPTVATTTPPSTVQTTARPVRNKEADDEGEKEDDIEPVMMVQNARRCWEKQRRIVAALSSGDNEVKLPATKVMRAEVKATTKTTIVVKSKAKAVSFRIIDDDDSESE